MSYASGGGAHAESEMIVQPAIIVGQVEAARRSATLRFRIQFVLVWLAIVGLISVGLGLADAWDWEFALKSGPVIVLQGVGITVTVALKGASAESGPG